MRIRSKIIGAIAGATLLLVAIGATLAVVIVLDRFRDLDRENLDHQVHTLEDTVIRDLTFLQDKSSDWGTWDDAYAWTQGKNDGFLAANVTVDAARAARVECILFLRFDGRQLASSTADLGGTGQLAGLPFLPEHLIPGGLILGPVTQGKTVNGLLRVNDDVIGVAAMPVRKADLSGTPSAAVVMARRIDKSKVAEWTEILGTPVHRIPLPAKASTGVTARIVDDRRMIGTTVILDLAGQPGLALEIEHERVIWMGGLRTIQELLIAGGVALTILVAGLLWLLDRTVVRPIGRLAREVREIERDGPPRLTIEGNDEITVLAQAISNAVERQRSAIHVAGALERRWRTLFERSADAVILIDGDVVRAANQAASNLFGLPPGQDLVGRSWRALVPEAAERGDSTSTGQEVVIDTGRRDELGRPVQRIVELRQSAVDLDGQVLGQVLMHDITQRRAAEEDRRLLASMADYTADAVVIAQVGGEIVYRNQAFRTLSGLFGDMTGADHLEGLFATGHQQLLREGLDRSLTLGGWRGELDLQTATDRLVPVSVGVVVIRDHEDRPTHLGLVLRDITAERERQAMLVQARTAAEETAKAKSDFLAVMSHELRTPLNGIIGMASLLKLQNLNAEQQDQLGTIDLCANHLLTQINDILDFSRLEAGKVEVERIPFTLARVVADIQRMLKSQADAKGLPLTIAIAPGLEGPLLGDPTRVRQVLLNLVGNALKFTTAGSIAVTAGTTPEGRLRIAVQDTGMGIAPEVLGRLFQPFVQADSTITRTHGGTGLGLVICRRLCELMGGTIQAASVLGQGSTFTVELPLRKAQVPVAPVEAPPTTLVERPSLNLRVLVADDAQTNQILTRRLLKFLGCTCAIVEDGEAALALMASEPFDVVLMDGQMPGLDGLEATRRWRALEQAEGRPHLPIIALTALAQSGDESRFLAAGVDGYLAKPFTLEDLQRKLTKVLRAVGR